MEHIVQTMPHESSQALALFAHCTQLRAAMRPAREAREPGKARKGKAKEKEKERDDSDLMAEDSDDSEGTHKKGTRACV
jgi:hypothetical protein